jgi:SAM-dependent methyltransferase
VYSFGVLHHIYAVEEVISEVYRVLKPGGTVRFACYNKWSAFHFFIKLIHDGLRLNWLFSKGYSGLLATIERGADGITIKPYVKLYSKSEIKELFNSFDIVDISVHQLKQDHFYPSFLGKLAKPFITKLQEKIGWYIACKAIKPNL